LENGIPKSVLGFFAARLHSPRLTGICELIDTRTEQFYQFDGVVVRLKYSQEISRLPHCPPDDAAECERVAYRFVHENKETSGTPMEWPRPFKAITTFRSSKRKASISREAFK